MSRFASTCVLVAIPVGLVIAGWGIGDATFEAIVQSWSAPGHSEVIYEPIIAKPSPDALPGEGWNLVYVPEKITPTQNKSAPDDPVVNPPPREGPDCPLDHFIGEEFKIPPKKKQ